MAIPFLLFGTSPFVGASQFARRSFSYYMKFYMKPKNIEKLLEYGFRKGIRGVQALPHRPILESIENLQSKGMNLEVVGTIGPEHPLHDVENFIKLNCKLVLTHGVLTDHIPLNKLMELIDLIEEHGLKCGVVTHQPYKTLSLFLEENFHPLAIMLPYNSAGLFMDATPGDVLTLLKRFRFSTFIAKKVLGAGRLDPENEFKFIRETGVFASIALGMVCEKEVDENVELIKKIFGKV